MRILLLVAFLLTSLALYHNRVIANPIGVSEEGRQVVVQSNGVETRFTKLGPASGTFMLFGGIGQDTVWANADMSVIDGPQVEWLSRTWPDFYMCKSPGAKQAMELTHQLSLVAASGSVRNTLQGSVHRFEENLRGNGERVCVALSGQRLAVSSSTILANGTNFLQQIKMQGDPPSFMYVESAEIVDCQTITR